MTYNELTTVDFGYDKMLRLLSEGETFDFSRYGDGEFECINNKRNRSMNSDSHRYFPDLAEALLQVLKESPLYYVGLQTLAYRQKTDFISDLAQKYGLRFFKSNFIHTRNQKFGLEDYFDVLKKRKVVVVGAPHLRKINNYFPVEAFIEVPLIDAWLARDKIADQIEPFTHDPETVISYSCGMMKCILIHQFQNRVTQLNNGSIFDPWCGMNTRSYHFEMEAGKGNEMTRYFKIRKGLKK